MTARNWWPVVAAMAGLLFVVDSIFAIVPEVRDDAKLFSPAAVKKADAIVRDIYRQHDRDVLVETFATVPAGDVEKVKSLDTAQRDAYFLQWAKDRSRDRMVNGIYVLICKDPRHLEVGVIEKEPHKFASGTSDAIKSALRQEFKEGRYDEGLEQALKLAQERIVKK
jgi:hypothetical protein